MTFPAPDPVIYLARMALQCLADAIVTTKAETVAAGMEWDAPQSVCYRVSTQIPFDMDKYQDMCCEGLGYVAIGGTWVSSDQFPEADIQRQAQARCAPPSWAQEYRMGLVRCIPVVTAGPGGAEGGMPTCDEWTTAAYTNMWDSVCLRTASCCFRARYLSDSTGYFEGMSFVIDRQIQGPPLGGCVERYVTMQTQFRRCEICG